MTDQVVEIATTGGPEVRNSVKEVNPVQHTKERKRGREGRLKKVEDRKAAEQLLKWLNEVHSTEEKIGVITNKYVELIDEKRTLQSTLKQYNKKILDLQREKDQLQNERCKALLTRERLESLCRELQKQNKAIKEESLIKIREQEQLRRKLSEEFYVNLGKMKTVMHTNIDKSTKMYEEYHKMNKTFQSVHAEVQSTEHQFLNVQKYMKDALDDAREVRAEYEALKKENQGLLFKIAEYEAEIKAYQQTEVSLRSQIALYTDKYEEFQKTILRSDKISDEFTEEMSLMSKKLLMLEQEATLWKQRWENMHATVIDMAADKQARDIELANLTKKMTFLKELCRGLQEQKMGLMATLKKKEQQNGESQSDKSTAADEKDSDKTTKQIDELSEKISLSEDGSAELKDSLDMLKVDGERLNDDDTGSIQTEAKEASAEVASKETVESSSTVEHKEKKSEESSEAPVTVTVSPEKTSELQEDPKIHLAIVSSDDHNTDLVEMKDVNLDGICNDTRKSNIELVVERLHETAKPTNSETEAPLERLREVSKLDLGSIRNELPDVTIVSDEKPRNTVENTDDNLKNKLDVSNGSRDTLETNGDSHKTCPPPNQKAVLIKDSDNTTDKTGKITVDLLPVPDTETCTKEQSAEVTQSLSQTNTVQNNHGETKIKKSKGSKKKRK